MFPSLGVVFYLAVTYTDGTAGCDIPFKLLCFISKGFILKNLFRGVIPDVPIIKKIKEQMYIYKNK